jgi:hypothetical protein
MLKVFGNFDRARINRARGGDKLRRFSGMKLFLREPLGIIFVHFILWQKIVLGYFYYLQMIEYLRDSFHYKRYKYVLSLIYI